MVKRQVLTVVESPRNFNMCCQEGFNPDNAFELFKETGDNQLYPNDKIFEILYVGMDKNSNK